MAVLEADLATAVWEEVLEAETAAVTVEVLAVLLEAAVTTACYFD